MEHSEETASETESERGRCLRFKKQGGIIKRQFIKSFSEGIVIICFHREQACVNLRFYFLETRQSLFCGIFGRCQSITDRCPVNGFHSAGNPAYLTAVKSVGINLLRS